MSTMKDCKFYHGLLDEFIDFLLIWWIEAEGVGTNLAKC